MVFDLIKVFNNSNFYPPRTSNDWVDWILRCLLSSLRFFLLCWRRGDISAAATTPAKHAAEHFFGRPRQEYDYERHQQQDVQQHVLEPIKVVGSSPQVFRAVVPGNVFDPKHGLFQRWQRVVSEHGRRLFGIFPVPAISYKRRL